MIRLMLAVFIVAAACSSAPAAPTAQPSVRVLMVTATAGFRHDSIATARDVMSGLGSTRGFAVTLTEDLSTITSSRLADYDVLMFALTTGELALTPDQQAALTSFVSRGGGFVGIHSATDTFHGWPEYGQMIGAYFKEHPWTQAASVVVDDSSHPAMAGVTSPFSILEEFYTFTENPRPRVQVLLRLDASSVGATGDYPLAWAKPYGNGRVYYNALGHFPETWRDSRFQTQLTSAIGWAAGS